MDPKTLFQDGFTAHAALARTCGEALAEPFAAMLAVWTEAIRDGNKILMFGNGGSAADAQHLATELVVRFVADRAPIPAIALTTDTSTLTAAGNDYGFDQVFARQVRALGRPGDVALGISTSGRSANITAALEAARDGGLVACALAGRDGGDLVGRADPLLIVPSQETPLIQEMHITIGHLLCAGLERNLGLVT